jgi:3'-phosphoadenosine 5'-phosphosulfate sulfotransferase (PAPS reductase)/FAD synthetase
MGLQEWKLRACCSEYHKHVAVGLKVVHEALESGRWVLSWSGGKDSTAMVHLVRSVALDIPIMVQFDDCDWPEKRPYIDRVAKSQGWEYHAVEPTFSVWEAASRLRLGMDNICAQSHALTKDSFLRLLDEKRRQLGCDGVFLGLRAAESRSRAMNAYTRGMLYERKDGTRRCCPLVFWTVEDVFAYLVEHAIEINPCYLNNGLRKPEEIRLSWALPTPTGIRYGDMSHLRRYYPRQFRRLRDLGVQ